MAQSKLDTQQVSPQTATNRPSGNQWLPQIDPDLCNGCGLCIDLCPSDALGWRGQVAALTRPDRCNYCATCETVCPTGAIELPYLVCKREPAAL